MNRKNFIGGILGFSSLFTMAKEKKKTSITLLETHVAGIRYYDGLRLHHFMKSGDELQVIREPFNEHDDCAIALKHENRMIGYVPMSDNDVLARMMDEGLQLHAKITRVDENPSWDCVHIEVYMIKEEEMRPKWIDPRTEKPYPKNRLITIIDS